MSLRPPLHVCTFHSRTVVSMFGRLCHLFVHALSSLQVANAQCMTLRSLAPCLRAAREKHRFAAGKKHRNGKKHVWQQEKNALQREKAVSAAGKNASKKCRFAAGKIQSSRKNTLQQHKSTFAAEKMHFGGSGKKPSEAEKNPSEARKNRPRQEKNQQQRKSSFATQKVAATEKIHFRNGKKQQPSGLASQTWPCHILGSHKGWFLRNRCLPHVDVLKVGFFHSSSCHACLGQASVSLGAPRMPTNLLHHGSQNRIQKTSRKTWRPERDLDCTRNTVGRREKKHVLTLTLMLVRRKSACKTSPGSSKILRWLTPLLGPNLDPKTGPKQRPKRRNENVIQFWTPFWGPYLDPKMGSAIGEFRCCPHMLCKQICDPAA